jgi:3-dehydroquinate synthase
LQAALHGRDVSVHVIADGERSKTLETWSGIIDCLVAMRARRDSSAIALGGGVVGDITGFAAATYMRGIKVVQIPTTLLAQVDASIGGKTGINHAAGKNLIGAFHQPEAVVIDTSTLDTLQEREFNAGMAEVVKYGAIMDAVLFDWLESNTGAIRNRDADALQFFIRRAVENKAEVVSADEKEAGIRAILNFGHSFGHALETLTAYCQFLHGEAVAIGMVIAARLSEARGLCNAGVADRVRVLLQRLGLPVEVPESASTAAMIAALDLDKKAVASGPRLILLERIGKALVDSESTHDEMAAAIEFCRPLRART